MSLQTLLSIIAASIGFVSGVWLCVGAVFIKPAQIVRAADESWDAEPNIAETLITQSAEYLTGGFLLIVSFGLQVVAASVPTANLQWPCQALLSPWFIAPATLVVSGLLSYPIFKWRKRDLLQKVQSLKAN